MILENLLSKFGHQLSKLQKLLNEKIKKVPYGENAEWTFQKNLTHFFGIIWTLLKSNWKVTQIV